jgi:hypothetical protein
MKLIEKKNLIRLSKLGLACIIIYSCSNRQVNQGMLILTETPGNINSQDYLSGVSGNYLRGARISSIIPGKTSSQNVLTKGFYSACSPDISYDGKSILFAAQPKQEDPWQIWEMNLDNLKSRRVTSSDEHCTDPVYLPGGRLAFSRMTVNDTVKSAYCLYTCNLDGSDLRQITFSPADNLATTLLKDGRLLTVSRQLFPGEKDPMLMVMRPDGTKADMFYKSTETTTLISSAHESTDGKLLFIESRNEATPKGHLVSITYNRPLHSRIDLTSGVDGDFCAVLPFEPHRYLVSCRKADSDHFALYEFDPEKKQLGEMVYSDPEYSIVDILLAEAYERPRKLPSEVDLLVKTGLLLCQDINFLNPLLSDSLSDKHKASKIEILGIDTTYGVVEVENDGSFQLKVMADTPFRIKTLDEKGNIVSGPCSWLWLRPNERRGCIGCHEDPELAPENRVSLAIKKSPVIIPVHISEIKEKIVDLE